MTVQLRTIINNDVVFNDIGQVKTVQSGEITITQATQTVFFTPISATTRAYIIATFLADTVYSLEGFTTEITTTNSFLFDGGGQGGTLNWQLIEVY